MSTQWIVVMDGESLLISSSGSEDENLGRFKCIFQMVFKSSNVFGKFPYF